MYNIRKHKDLLGVYKGDFMQEPSSETLADLNSTFHSFLKKYNLEAMKVILQISNELQGYGYLNEVSALYGLIWNKPKFMFGYLVKSMFSLNMAMFRLNMGNCV